MSAATKTRETYAARAQRRRQECADFQTRALELAFDRGLVGTARLEATYGSGIRQYRVPCHDRRGDGYLVTVNAEIVTCSCPAGQFGHGRLACAHAGAALYYERQRLQAQTSTRDVAWDWWMAGGEW